MKLVNRIAIVTGSGDGIGQACAVRLSQEGATVVVADLREQAIANTLSLIEGAGGRGRGQVVDVTDRRQVVQMVEKTVNDLGAVDVLVNVAGGSSHYPRPGEAPMSMGSAQSSIEETSEGYWDYIIDLNLKGSFLCGQAVIADMKRRKFGRIVNFSSMLGRTARPPLAGAAYSAAKGGVIAMTRYFAAELAPHNITVNAIAPGFVMTERAGRINKTLGKEAQEAMTRDIPLGRASDPAEQAAVAAFLASDDASYVTGMVMDVNGGWHMA